MIDNAILDKIENENLTQEDITCLLDKLCKLGTKSRLTVSAKVIIFLKSRTQLYHVNREEVANYLHMSSRTLSRKLQKEGTGFHKLLDEERKQRCLHHMRCNNICGREISELLGLSDTSQFYKSFKKWTGHSFSETKSMLAKNHRDYGMVFHIKKSISLVEL